MCEAGVVRHPESRNPENAVGGVDGGVARGDGGEGEREGGRKQKSLPQSLTRSHVSCLNHGPGPRGSLRLEMGVRKPSFQHFVRVEGGAKGSGWASGTQ